MTPDTKILLDFIANVGIPGGILLVIVLALIRLVPVYVRSLEKRDKQAQAIADCMPRIEQCVEKMADGNSTLLDLLRQMNAKLDQIHEYVRK